MIKVVIYDDHALRCESLKALLSCNEDMECVGSFSNCNNAVKDMEELQPEVVLMDIAMPGEDGISGVRKIKKKFPHIRIIMQTVFEDEARIFASLQAGAEGYILKNASPEKIIQSIRDVADGGASMTPSVALRVMKFFNEPKHDVPEYNLTNKEKEVLTQLSAGSSYKKIASNMGISYFTVNTHVRNIYEKLHVHCVGEAVSIALKNKII